MNKNLPLCAASLAAAVALSACAPMPALPADWCATGTTVTITYGIYNNKTRFQVKENVKVKKGEGLVFKLDPKGSTQRAGDLKTANVKIMGKSDNSDNDWFTLIEGSYNSTSDTGHKLGICATADPGTYEYEVDVHEFGTLDPRVIVE